MEGGTDMTTILYDYVKSYDKSKQTPVSVSVIETNSSGETTLLFSSMIYAPEKEFDIPKEIRKAVEVAPAFCFVEKKALSFI